MPVSYRCSTTGCGGRVDRSGRYCDACTKTRNAKKRPNKALYASTAWQDLARAYKARNPICQWVDSTLTPCRRIVELVDHILPIQQGGEELDPSNCQSLCGEHHSTKTNRELGRSKPDVFVVCGAPGSGKSTLVNHLAQPGELIIDLDAIKIASNKIQEAHEPISKGSLGAALAMRDAAIAYARHATGVNRIWIVDTAPARAKRCEYRDTLGACVIVLVTPRIDCTSRITNRTKRVNWWDLVDRWWDSYEPDDRDIELDPSQLASRLDILKHARG